MNTMLLDVARWDIILNAQGNIAAADDPYSTAQDVASEVRTFRSEVFYDTTIGLPYLSQILGHAPPAAFVQAQVEAAALRVPGVLNPICTIFGLTGRQLTGQVEFTDTNGSAVVAAF